MEVYNEALYDDFTGFTFNGQHSSQFGLLRVSDGDRYEDNFVPSLSNESANVPGGFGKYYLGETIKEKKFRLSMAYDNIGEKDKRRIKHWLHPDDELHELIFDERPYIKYWVKCSKEVTTNELCFNDSYITGTDSFGKPKYSERRVYKGDFKIEFTAYMPYGLAVNKDLKQFNPSTTGALYPRDNYEEWADSSGLIELDRYGIRNNFNGLQANVYNGGDMETGFEMTFEMAGKSTTFTYRGTQIETTKNYAPTIINGLVSAETNIYCLMICDETGTPLVSEAKSSYADDEEVVFYYKTKSGEFVEMMSGKIITTTKDYYGNTANRSVFESYTTGQTYTLYNYRNLDGSKIYHYYIDVLDKFDDSFWYKFVNVYYKDGNKNKPLNIFIVRVYGNDAATKDGYYVYDSSQKKYYIKVAIPEITTFEDKYKTLTTSGFTSSVCDFLLKSGGNTINSFRLSVPGVSTTDTKYWSEAQKAIATGGQFKINTNKQTISYRQQIQSTGQWGEWIGLNGLISDGELFKIPTDIDKYLDGINSSTKFNKIVIQHSNPQSIGNITDATISYEYLYI